MSMVNDRGGETTKPLEDPQGKELPIFFKGFVLYFFDGIYIRVCQVSCQVACATSSWVSLPLHRCDLTRWPFSIASR